MEPNVKLELEEYFQLLQSAIENMNHNLIHSIDESHLHKAYQIEEMINSKRKELELIHFDRIEKGVYDVQMGALFLEFVNSIERIRDNAINVNEALAGRKLEAE